MRSPARNYFIFQRQMSEITDDNVKLLLEVAPPLKFVSNNLMSVAEADREVNLVRSHFFVGPIPWIMGAELFRQEPRPKAMALINVTMWISAFIIAMMFEPLQVSVR
jgi:Sugar (and other) transporter